MDVLVDDCIIIDDSNDVHMIDLECEENRDIEKKCDALMSVLVDVDPVYAREICSEYVFRQEDFEQFVAQVVESGNYPKVQAQTSNGGIPPPQKKDFSIDEFLEKFPQPLEVFQNRNRENATQSYIALSLEYLKERFKFVSISVIRQILKANQNNLTKATKQLEMQPASRKTKRTKFEMNPIHTYNQDFEDEMNFLNHEAEINEYMENQILLKAARIEEAKARGELLVCGCCFTDDLLRDEMLHCEEGHMFCRTCLKSHANIIIGEQKVTFPCLQECNSQFSYETIKQVVKTPVYEKLLKRLQEYEVKAAGIEGLEFCPFCEYAEIPPEGDRIFRCKSCLKESCRLCHKDSHIPFKCDEADDNRLTKVRTQVEERISECLIRTCPKCQRKFIKEDGCNKMTCSCGATMCYLCRKPVKGYDHFSQKGSENNNNKCPLYSNNDELHFTAIEQEAQRLQAEALAKEPALADKLDPLKGLRPPSTKAKSPLHAVHRRRGGARGAHHHHHNAHRHMGIGNQFMLQLFYQHMQP